MFQKATKARRKLRAAMFGPSGAGKTYSSLAIATGLGESIAVIDTERGSASLYSDDFSFDVAELENRTIAGYVHAIQQAGAAGYEVLIIDSLTHAWQELLQQVEQLAQAKYRGNTWSAWSEGTPRQRQLVDAILDYPGHVIATMRSKTEWTTEKNRNGKDTPVRVGLAPEQGKGIEYEFDVLFEVSVDHTVNVIKDRSKKFQDCLFTKPGREFGLELRQWLADGVEPAPRPAAAPPAPAAPTREVVAPKPAPVITEQQYGQLWEAMEASLTIIGQEAFIQNTCSALKVADLQQLPAAAYAGVIEKLADPARVQHWNNGKNATGGPLLTDERIQELAEMAARSQEPAAA